MATNQQRRAAAQRKLRRQNERRARQDSAMKTRLAIVGVVAAIVVIAGITFLVGRSSPPDSTQATPGSSTTTQTDQNREPGATSDETPASDEPDSANDSTPPPSTSASGDTATCDYPAGRPAARDVAPPSDLTPSASGTVDVQIALNSGEVQLQLDRAAAPCTVNSFLSLAEQGYFDDITCHRLTSYPTLSVLQCGDPSGTGSGGPGYSFADELTGQETYPAGTVAMANAGPDTNGSQFFLVYADSQLPPQYTVFGQITSGLEVLADIAADGTATGAEDGAPAQPVTINAVTF